MAPAIVSETASAPRSRSVDPGGGDGGRGGAPPFEQPPGPGEIGGQEAFDELAPERLDVAASRAKAMARSTITATDSTDSAMSTQRTHSEPSSVKPRIRWVRCIALRRRRQENAITGSPELVGLQDASMKTVA